MFSSISLLMPLSVFADSCSRMRLFSLILFLAVMLTCGGCQSITGHMKQSLSSAADDYHRVTTGSGSSYIAGQRPKP
jgi:hypothetical protein